MVQLTFSQRHNGASCSEDKMMIQKYPSCICIAWEHAGEGQLYRETSARRQQSKTICQEHAGTLWCQVLRIWALDGRSERKASRHQWLKCALLCLLKLWFGVNDAKQQLAESIATGLRREERIGSLIKTVATEKRNWNEPFSWCFARRWKSEL